LVELQLIFHFFLAGLFMYYLARDFTGDRAAALLAGALFMYSGDMVAHTQHIASVESLAWYPAIFLVARRALFRNDYYLAFAGGVLFALLNLVGHWQHSVYLGLLLFLYFAQEAIFGR